MIKNPMLVQDAMSGVVVETNREAVALGLLLGDFSPITLVRDLGLRLGPWQPAYAHPRLRRQVLDRASLPGVLDRIDWIAPNGRTYRATSPDGLRAAAHAGYATASTCVALYSAAGCFEARAHELLPHEQRDAWPPGMTALALVAGVAATGVAFCAVQHYQRCHTPVSLRDPALRAELYERDGGLCGLCNSPVRGNDFHLDHRHPRVRGGEDTRANLHVTHPACNLRKGALTVDEYHAR